jgi:sterol carrier protein 2
MAAKAAKTKAPVYVLGVGMTKFIKPRGKVDYTELGFEAGVKALIDAGVNYDDMDAGVACYCYGDSTCGQRVFYQFGMVSQIEICCSGEATAGYFCLSLA